MEEPETQVVVTINGQMYVFIDKENVPKNKIVEIVLKKYEDFWREVSEEYYSASERDKENSDIDYIERMQEIRSIKVQDVHTAIINGKAP